MSPNVLKTSACNGSLISELTKSSNLTGKNSYCILTTGHHKCILTKYMTELEKLYCYGSVVEEKPSDTRRSGELRFYFYASGLRRVPVSEP
jgi:hypothetical protein